MSIAAVMLTVGAVAATGLLVAGGFMPGKAEPAAETQATEPVAVKVSSAAPPSLTVPERLLESPGEGIVPDGSVMGSATTPWPMGCHPEDSPVPLASLSRAMTMGSDRLQVTVQTFAPGAGAVAFEDQAGAARSCRGGARVSSVGDQAAEQVIWSGAPNGTRMTGSSFRSGDVIVHVSGAGSRGASGALSTSLDALLQGVCADPESTAGDYPRNPLSPEPGPWMVQEEVEIDDPGLPAVPEGDDYTPTAIPAADLPALDPAKPMPEPSWPVWPLMPDPVERPEPADAPADEPVLTSSIEVMKHDEQGPGCGWSWTGQSPSVFDARQAALTNLTASMAATEELERGAGQWQDDVLGYWESTDRFRVQAAEWNRYASDVATVNDAWGLINDDWDRYRRELADWQHNEEEIARFATAQTEAEHEWTTSLEQCADAQEQELASPSPTEPPAESTDPDAPEASPTPEPTDTSPEEVAPVPDPAEPVDCAARHPRPDILDMAGPLPYDRPSEPTDPRPTNWEQIASGEADEGEGQ